MNKLKNFKFTDYAKYLLLAPLCLIILSVIVSSICAICGVGYFNLDYDYKSSYSFEVKFNATITDSEYKIYEDLVTDSLKDKGITSFRFYELGEGVYSRLEVKGLNDSNSANFETVLKDLQVYFIENLETTATQAGATTNVRISVTDFVVEQAMNPGQTILFLGIALLVVMAFAFLYMFIRFNLMAGVSLVLSLLYETAMLTALVSLVRIPVNSTIYVAYVFMYVFTIIFNMSVFSSVRESIDSDVADDNAKIVVKAVNDNTVSIALVSAVLLAAAVVFILCGYAFVKFTAMAVAFAILVSLYFVLFANPTIWSKLYNRKGDYILRKKQEYRKKKLEKKSKDEEEKILV